MLKIAKEKEEKKTKKVHISIYEDELKVVSEKLEIKEVTSKTVREALGLTPTHSKTGVTTKLIAEIRKLSDEEKEKRYNEIIKEKD